MNLIVEKDGLLKVRQMVSKAAAAPVSGKYKWWHAAAALVVVTLIGALQSGSSKHTRKFYQRKNKQAPWAPPAWLFGPAWTVNNIFLLWGLVKILNNKGLRDRLPLLALQGGIWAIFLSFGYVYFRKGSPVLAEVWTQTDAALATASIIAALRSDKKLAIAYLPLFAWTWFASSLSAYQALKNPDPLLGTPPLIDKL
jgi:tryptophan-rich sensory protein